MAPSSIQVSAATRKRLAEYRVDGLTYEDVLKLMMAIMPAKDFERLHAEHQLRLAAAIRKNSLSLDDLVHSVTPRKKV